MFVLDASALLALLDDEPGAALVEEHLGGATVLSVNLEEVAGTLIGRGMPAVDVELAVAALNVTVMPFNEAMAWLSAQVRPRLPGGLGIADRCCLAAAAVLGAGVVTADALWTTAGPAFGVEVTLIR
jgi:ribonuclease VapC